MTRRLTAVDEIPENMQKITKLLRMHGTVYRNTPVCCTVHSNMKFNKNCIQSKISKPCVSFNICNPHFGKVAFDTFSHLGADSPFIIKLHQISDKEMYYSFIVTNDKFELVWELVQQIMCVVFQSFAIVETKKTLDTIRTNGLGALQYTKWRTIIHEQTEEPYLNASVLRNLGFIEFYDKKTKMTKEFYKFFVYPNEENSEKIIKETKMVVRNEYFY